ncbi:hypothetical protein AB0M12_39455 [Nocardia vinacea]|uniref:hypothetical protein n=1 Tax=Nocardia vinacea TaxID=96468 RepID=UPI003418B9A6
MPQRGEFSDLDPDDLLSPEWRLLAEVIRELIRQTGRSCRAIEQAIQEKLDDLRRKTAADELRCRQEGYLTRSVLSDLANGRRKRAPKEAILRELHELARISAEAEDEVIPWEILDSIRRRLETKPAETIPAVTAGVVPVPHQEGDRHHSGNVDLVWLPATDLAVYISVGNFERANGLIRHVGTEADPAETANAVVACRDLGLLEVTDTIISYAGSRSERDVLKILHLLKQRGRRVDADALLDSALARAS